MHVCTHKKITIFEKENCRYDKSSPCHNLHSIASERPFHIGFIFLKKWAKPDLFLSIFVLFSHWKDKYSTSLTINYNNINFVPGSRTRGGRK